MANSPANTNRLFDGGIAFLKGLNSNLHPSLLDAEQISWAVNTQNRGGVIDTRDGYLSRLRLPDGKAQGAVLFTPTGSTTNIVMAVSGKIYVSAFPFTSYTVLPGIQFNPYAEQVVFKEALQAKNLSTVIDPKAVLMMQDGMTRAAYWDGAVGRHLAPGGTSNETVQGMWMEWIGNRLWVSRGRELFASDIFDPLHFTENTYLSIGGSLNAMDGGVITGLARTADNRSLLVFTIANTTIVKAGITDRSTWATTPDFISLLFPGVGCSAGKSIFYNDGDLWWFSVEGARNFSQVGSSILNSHNDIASIEMKRSFENITQTAEFKVCGFAFNTYLGFSVPSGDVHNRHTWVLDTSSNSQLTGSAPYAWQSVWMGTRPVEWATGNVNGTQRAFYLSQDACGVRLWEAFMPDRLDNGERIFGSIEFGGATFKEPTSYKKYLYTEWHLNRMRGRVDITTDYRSDYGCWNRNAELSLCAEPCFTELICNAPNPTLQSQNRYFKTQNASHNCTTSEGPYSDNIGTYFQNRIQWYGRNAIRIYKASAQQFEETSVGACAKSDINCKAVPCCDPETNYVSPTFECFYGSGSSIDICCQV